LLASVYRLTLLGSIQNFVFLYNATLISGFPNSLIIWHQFNFLTLTSVILLVVVVVVIIIIIIIIIIYYSFVPHGG
jgi:hypothetical protein